MIIGYRIVGIGSDDHGIFENFNETEEDEYSNVYDLNYIDPKFKLRARFRKYDYVVTYDGYDLVSEKFKNFCEKNQYTGLEFVILPNTLGYYWLKANVILELDLTQMDCLFEQYSEKYKTYWGVYRPNPLYFKKPEELKDGFYRTDICFGDAYSKHPILIIGLETKLKIITEGLKGVYYEDIEYHSN
jgi:hypothetical protein